MSDLADRACVPCRGDVAPLGRAAIDELLAQLSPEWQVVREHHVVREFAFRDFVTALAFTNEIGAVAEEQGHHPDILLRWGQVWVTIWTHAIDGLTESDFVLAAKIDRLFSKKGESS
jgi:4a-hydroxytetrahydrobiopterin dehydratase